MYFHAEPTGVYIHVAVSGQSEVSGLTCGEVVSVGGCGQAALYGPISQTGHLDAAATTHHRPVSARPDP